MRFPRTSKPICSALPGSITVSMSHSLPFRPASGLSPGPSARFDQVRFLPWTFSISRTGYSSSRGPWSVRRSVTARGMVICWLKGMPGNSPPRIQPMISRRPSSGGMSDQVCAA